MGEGSAGQTDFGRHYDERSPVGDELLNGQIHMWYWYGDDDDAPLTTALQRMTTKVTDTLDLRPGERVLDAGCGPGHTAIYLAATFGVQVTGVTISAFEVERGNQRALESGVSDLAQFGREDFMALSFPDGSFDAVLALESLQNAADLGQVFRELFRVLRPGGRLTFSDLSLTTEKELDRVATFMASIKLTQLPTLAEWLEHASGAGFVIEEYTQCGPRVFGTKSKYLKAAMVRRAELVTTMGEGVVAEFSLRHRGFFAPRKDQIGYVIVAARKPLK